LLDLRHTVGTRLREADVPENTFADILWHSNLSMTRDYSMAQIAELHAAQAARLRREHEEAMWGLWGRKVPPTKRNSLETEISKLLM
jgi:integrase